MDNIFSRKVSTSPDANICNHKFLLLVLCSSPHQYKLNFFGGGKGCPPILFGCEILMFLFLTNFRSPAHMEDILTTECDVLMHSEGLPGKHIGHY